MKEIQRISGWKLALLTGISIIACAPLAAFAAPQEDFSYKDEPIHPGEVDPNTLSAGETMPTPETDETATPAESDQAEISPAPEVKSVRARVKSRKAVSSPEKPPVARDIPLIETENEVITQENVVFVTGGVGDEERRAIEASKADYNVHIMNTSKTGAFEGDVRVVITKRDAKDDSGVMLNLVAGPLLYARLPQGQYTLTATLGERTITKPVTLRKKGQGVNLTLSW